MLLLRPAGESEASLIANLSRQAFEKAFAAFNTEADMAIFRIIQFSVEILEADTRLPGLNLFCLAGRPTSRLFEA